MDMPEIAHVTDEEFNGHLKSTAEFVEHVLSDGTQERFIPNAPVFYIEYNAATDKIDDTAAFCLLADFDYDQRYEQMRQLGYKFGSEKKIVKMVFFCVESWLGVVQDLDAPDAVRPSEDPKRREIVAVHGMTVDGRVNMAMVHLRRTKRKKLLTERVELHPYGGEWKGEARLLQEFYQGFIMGLMVAMPHLAVKAMVNVAAMKEKAKNSEKGKASEN